VEENKKKIMRNILTFTTCFCIVAMLIVPIQASTEQFTRMNPGVTIAQLENVLKQTGITVYTNKEKQETVTERKCENRNVYNQ